MSAKGREGTDPSTALVDGPYSLDTLVLPPAEQEGKQTLGSLLDSHVMSRAALSLGQKSVEDVAAATGPQQEPATQKMTVRVGVKSPPQAPSVATEHGPLFAAEPEGTDLMLALGVPQDEIGQNERSLLDTLLVWLVEIVAEHPDEQALPGYCDVLPRLAEECADQGFCTLASLALRFRRLLLRYDTADGDFAVVFTGLLDFASLVKAYVNDPENEVIAETLARTVWLHDDETQSAREREAAIGRSIHGLTSPFANVDARSSHVDRLIREAGDEVFYAGKSSVSIDSLKRHFDRFVADREKAAVGVAEVTKIRSLAEPVERRLRDLRWTVSEQLSLSRTLHADVAGLSNIPVQEAFAGVRALARAHGLIASRTLHFQLEGADVKVDAQCAITLGGALTRWTEAVIRHAGTPTVRDPLKIVVEVSRSGQMLHITLHTNIMADGKHTLSGSSTDWAEDSVPRPSVALRHVDGHAGADVCAERLGRLQHAATELGGSTRFQTMADGSLTVELSMPIWLTNTRGRLTPAGGGVLTIREAGIEQIAAVDWAKDVRDEGRWTCVQIGAESVRALWLLDLLGLDPSTATDASGGTALVIRVGGMRTAILAAGVSESLDFAVRGVDDQIPRLHGIVGGIILAGGEVSPLVDLPTLTEGYFRDLRRSRS